MPSKWAELYDNRKERNEIVSPLATPRRDEPGIYRVGLVVWQLGWVDLVLECSTILLGQLIATVAAHQPGELPKSKSTKTRYSATRVNL